MASTLDIFRDMGPLEKYIKGASSIRQNFCLTAKPCGSFSICLMRYKTANDHATVLSFYKNVNQIKPKKC